MRYQTIYIPKIQYFYISWSWWCWRKKQDKTDQYRTRRDKFLIKITLTTSGIRLIIPVWTESLGIEGGEKVLFAIITKKEWSYFAIEYLYIYNGLKFMSTDVSGSHFRFRVERSQCHRSNDSNCDSVLYLNNWERNHCLLTAIKS